MFYLDAKVEARHPLLILVIALEAKVSIASVGLGKSDCRLLTSAGALASDRMAALNNESGRSLVVSPKVAQIMLDCGETKIYELIANREIESFRDGKSRKITVRSIHARIERKLAEAASEK